MKVAVLGTGSVGRTIAAALSGRHEVAIGTRDVRELMDRSEGDPPFREWAEANPAVEPRAFADAAAHGEIVFIATAGTATLAALAAAGARNLAGKLLVDISNPLDFSGGFPPRLSVCNDDSLAEQIQRAHPDAKVVKTLNTVTASVMVDPGSIGDGEHEMFLCGNDAGAKKRTTEILTDWFGWRRVTDLGDITNARALEMYLPLWVRLYGSMGTGEFNIRIVR